MPRCQNDLRAILKTLVPSRNATPLVSPSSLSDSFTIETRMKWAQKALEQYPNKLPLIIERAAGTQNDESLGKL